MQVLLILGVVFLAYEVLRLQQGPALTSSGQFPPGSSSGPGVLQTTSLPSYTDVTGTDTGVGTGASAGISGSIAALNFIPVIGPALSAVAGLIAGGLMKASALRAKQATSENAAVAQAVPGWDAGVVKITTQYNLGQVTADDVRTFVMSPNCGGQGLLWQMFWKEVSPQIQPGRNGCKSGAVQQDKAGKSYCGPAGPAYGASCCVAYDSLDNSSTAILAALAQAEAQPGKAVGVQTVPVFAWKYGGINRPAYKVVLQKPAPARALASYV